MILLILLTILGIALLILGIIGCVVPAIPGPPLSFAALIMLEIGKKGDAFTNNQLILWAVIALLVTVLDYIIPAAGAKKYGATKWGVWGSIIGLIIGTIFLGPLGMFIGTFAGAVGGELFAGKKSDSALKAGFGTFMGTLMGIGLKLAASFAMTFYFFKALIK
ncbi:DUF456 domain-containing protein [candidate division KSB1 bacterium]|nr:DUF456 domain-containing protein [candidate division KSB1 bacterium]